jgi:hypothetical protein
LAGHIFGTKIAALAIRVALLRKLNMEKQPIIFTLLFILSLLSPEALALVE